MFEDRPIRIREIDAAIERLEMAVESCRKMVAVGKALLAGGLILLLVAVWKGEAVILVSSIAGSLGGLAIAGSNASTRSQLLENLVMLESEQTAAIETLNLQSVTRVCL